MGALALAEAISRPMEAQAGRPAVMNVWDNRGGGFQAIKRGLASGEISLPDAVDTGNRLLNATDPAKQKLGMHIHRLGMWQDPNLAREWVTTHAPKLSEHEHPRIRHSNIWTVRSAVWQDPSLAPAALQYAEAGLRDEDMGVQRASMWAMGDAVTHDPALFDRANGQIHTFLTEQPGESRDIFALERFYRPLRLPFGEEQDFRQPIKGMLQRSNGYPGLRARAARMLGEEIDSIDIVRDSVATYAKLSASLQGTPELQLLQAGDYGTLFNNAAHRFAEATTVGEGMGHLKTLRYVTWVSPDFLQKPFETVAETLADPRDGDLSRSASVFLADATLRHPDQFAEPAAAAVTNFFRESDIDGSQIVVSLVLDPLLDAGPEARRVVAGALPQLHTMAANVSVNFALSNH